MSNVEIVRRLYDGFAARDNAAILEVLHPEVEWIQNEGFPGGGRHVGAQRVLDDVFAKFRVEWSAWGAVVDEYLDAGAEVVVLGAYRGTAKRTGRAMSAAFAHVYTVEGGRIVRFRQYTDTKQVADALDEGR